MTDKEQIMIDGVDVSGCEYTCNTAFGKKGCKHPMMKNIYCFKNPNCYYKQLQKEKFENLNNKQMVESAENLINENSELYKSLKEKEQECEDLKLCLQQSKDNNKSILKLLVTNFISSCDKCPDNKNGYCIGIDECSSKCFKKLLDIINKEKDRLNEK